MTWSKIDDKFWWHRKTRAAGNAAVGAFVRMLSYSADQLSDGFIDDDTVALIATKKEVVRLEEVGFVEHVDGGLRLHDYHAYNPTREQALAERAAAAERQRRRRSGVTPPDPSRRDSPRDIDRDSRSDSRRESHDPVPSRPTNNPPYIPPSFGELVPFEDLARQPAYPQNFRRRSRAAPRESTTDQRVAAALAFIPEEER
jgi:hypothetical protein